MVTQPSNKFHLPLCGLLGPCKKYRQFYFCAPVIGSALGATNNVGMAAVHTVIGAASGVVNAAITGGDIGQGALIGGLSAGIARSFGGANGLDWPGRIALGATAGSAASTMNGGDFFEGAFQGAWTSAVAYIAEEAYKSVIAIKNSRRLTQNEIEEARKVFIDEIDYSKVRVINGKYFPFHGKGYAMSPDGNLYWPGDTGDLITSGNAGKFIHEMTHVWQYQNGINVLSKGLMLQIAHQLKISNVYSLTPGSAFNSYNIEQQGDLAMFIYFDIAPNNIPHKYYYP